MKENLVSDLSPLPGSTGEHTAVQRILQDVVEVGRPRELNNPKTATEVAAKSQNNSLLSKSDATLQDVLELGRLPNELNF